MKNTLHHLVSSVATGMFELNNLDLCVPSTVEEYFLIVDKMLNGSPNAKITEEERKELAENCNAFLERLGELYRVPVEVNA